MKKGFLIVLIIFSITKINAQKKENTIVKDTVKTEVINVVTAYNPKISDASKIKEIPKIEILKQSQKKKQQYNIFPAKLVSTFKPKTGGIKSINVGTKEKVYHNFIAAGYGNYNTPYLEAFLYHNTRFKQEYGLTANYIASYDNIKSTVLNSDFSNLSTGLFYKKEENHFNWKIGFDVERETRNWYGLPENINFTEPTINKIEEDQFYNAFQLTGDITFDDSLIKKGNITTFYFTDKLKSKEADISLNTKLDFPISFIDSDDLTTDINLEFLNGNFESNYLGNNPIKYSFFTATITPKYNFSALGFNFSTGVKITPTLDLENKNNQVLFYPDVSLSKNIIENTLSIYSGYTGGLTNNSYRNFTRNNPFVSPTLDIQQTSERTNAYLGFLGNLGSQFHFNIKTSYRDEQDKPLFIRNNSKSNGANNSLSTIDFKGYEYGNSFKVIYDDVKTISVFTELEYIFDKNLTLESSLQVDSYTTTNALEAFNLPNLQASVSAKYKVLKWYTTANIFFVGNKKDVLYNDIFQANIIGTEEIKSFVDINLNGGYHFNDKLSVFLKLNNILNTNYQQYINFDTQGFQVLGGLKYKFDFF